MLAGPFVQACGPAPASAPPATQTTAGTQPAASAGPKAIDRLRIATVTNIPHFNSLDGIVGPGQATELVDYHLYSSLTAASPLTNKFELSLAESADFSSDGLALRMKLRKGVRFHDGTELTAQDVKFTYDRKFDKANPSTFLGNIAGWLDGVSVVDPYTIEFKLKYAQRFLYEDRFTTPIYPKAYYERVGSKGIQEKPIGSGPYRMTDFMVNTRMTLEAFADYWGPKPLAKTLDVRFVAENTARANLLKSGEVDFADHIGIEDMKELKDRFEIYSYPGGQVANVRITTRHFPKAPWADVRVRQAMNYAIDRQTINKQIYDGLADVVPALFARSSFGFNKDLQPYTHDPAKAKRLMAEAGVTGFKEELVYPLGRFSQGTELMTAVAGYLSALGIQLTLRPVDLATWTAKWRACAPPEAPAFINMSTNSITNYDPLGSLLQVLPSTTCLAGEVDEDVDRLLLKEIPTITDLDRRLERIRSVEKIIYDKAYKLLLLETPTIMAAKRSVAWTPSPRFAGWTGWMMAGK